MGLIHKLMKSFFPLCGRLLLLPLAVCAFTAFGRQAVVAEKSHNDSHPAGHPRSSLIEKANIQKTAVLEAIRQLKLRISIEKPDASEKLLQRLDQFGDQLNTTAVYLLFEAQGRFYLLNCSTYGIVSVGKYKGGNHPLDRGLRHAAASAAGNIPVVFVFDTHKAGIVFDEAYPSVIAIGVGAEIRTKYQGQGMVFRNQNPVVVAGFSVNQCSGEEGGGVAIEDAEVMLLLNAFSSNKAAEQGGGVCCGNSSGRQALLWMNFFQGNTAPSGGGLALAGDTSSLVMGNWFENNLATGKGGGIYMTNCCLSLLAGNYIRENTVPAGSGGGIGLEHCAGAIIAGNVISNNEAFQNGGGIACMADSAFIHIPVLLSCNRITSNAASQLGGGISVKDDQEVLIIGNMITYNEADSGGGIFLHTSNLITQAGGNEIRSNHAVKGGGLYSYNAASIVYANKFETNTADSCGAGFMGFNCGTLAHNTLSDNQSPCGAGMQLEGGNSPRIHDNFISGNLADRGAGACISGGCDALVYENTFSSNEAATAGGGLFIRGNGTHPLIDTANLFLNNKAGEGGAIWFGYSSEPVICRSYFRNNLATRGGAVAAAASQAVVSDNAFVSNKALQCGGAVYVYPGQTLDISNNLFSNNIAGYVPPGQPFPVATGKPLSPPRGGAVMADGPGTVVRFLHNRFTENLSMLSDGGAVALGSVDGTFNQNTFLANFAAYGGLNGRGGAVYSEDSRLNHSGDSLLWNVATHGGGMAFQGSGADTLNHCVFMYNIADKDSLSAGLGGAVFLNGTVFTDSLIIVNSDFQYNYAALGGAIGITSGASSVKSSVFSSNRAASFSGSGSGGAIHAGSQQSRLQLGGNEALEEGNLFEQNTAGRPALPGFAHGGALSLTDGAKADIFGNTFNNHNACSGRGGAVYLQGTGTWCRFGEYNEGPITQHPWPSFQYGNIIQNNNRSLSDSVSYPVIHWPTDTTINPSLPDTLVTPPVWPDTTRQTLPLTALAKGIPLSVLPEEAFTPLTFLYVHEKYYGLKLLDATHPTHMLLRDSIRPDKPIIDYCSGNQRLAVLLHPDGLLLYSTDSLVTAHHLLFTDSISLPDSSFRCISLGGNRLFLSNEREIHALSPGDSTHQLSLLYTSQDTGDCSFSFLKHSGDRLYAILDRDSCSEILVFYWLGGELTPAGSFVMPVPDDVFELNDTLYVTIQATQNGVPVWMIKALDCTQAWNIQEIPALSQFSFTQEVLSIYADPSRMFVVLPDEIRVTEKAFNLTIIYPLAGAQYVDLNSKPLSQYIFGASPAAGIVSMSKTMLNPLDTLAPDLLSAPLSFTWPALLSFPPEPAWTPDIPLIPDTVVFDPPPGAGKFLPSPPKNLPFPNPVFPCDSSKLLITLDGGFLAVVDKAEAAVRGNLIGGESLEEANTARQCGGGIFVLDGGRDLSIGDTNPPQKDYTNFVRGNLAARGGGIYVKNHRDQTLPVINNHIGGRTRYAGNHAGETGGGIWADSSHLSLQMNYILCNSCGFDSVKEFNTVLPGYGGGIGIRQPGNTDIGYNWIIGNFSMGNAGGLGLAGIRQPNTGLQIHHNTFTENHAVDEGTPREDDTLVRPVGTEICINLQDDSLWVLNIPVVQLHHNLVESLGITDAYALAVDTVRSDTAAVDLQDNNLWSISGKKYAGVRDQTGLNGNVSIVPSYADPAAGDYNILAASPSATYGWSPAPASSGISCDTLRVPSGYPLIQAAMNAAGYGDCILVDTSYQPANESFPVQVKDGVNLTGAAFAGERDLSLIRRQLIDGQGAASIFILQDCGPRTLIRGFSLTNASTAIRAFHSGGRIYHNVFFNNGDDFKISCDSAENGMPVIYPDHNTMRGNAVVLFSAGTPGEEASERIAAGPVFTYNTINQLITNIDSLYPDPVNHRPGPWINIGLAHNHGHLQGYYPGLPWPVSGISGGDPGFYDTLAGDYRLQNNSHLLDFRRSNRFSGALYVALRPDFECADTLAFIPFTVQLLDSSEGHPRDSLRYCWHLSTGDSSIAKSPVFTIQSEGLHGCALRVRDPYQSEYLERDSLFRGLLPGGAIHGLVYYDRPDKPLMDSVRVVITDTAGGWADTLMTSSMGDYWISGLAGGNYVLTAEPLQNPGGINMIDALLTLLHYAGLDTLSGLPLLAADVNASGNVNAVDGLLIQRYFVGLIPGFPRGPWVAEIIPVIIPSGQNTFRSVRTAVLSTGDANASFHP